MVNLRGIGAVLGIGVMACVFLVTFDNHWMISVPNALTGNSAQLFKLHQGKFLNFNVSMEPNFWESSLFEFPSKWG